MENVLLYSVTVKLFSNAIMGYLIKSFVLTNFFSHCLFNS